MTENEAYEQVAAEIAGGNMQPGLWARAFSEAMGLQDQARALYIKLRVTDVLEEARLAEQRERHPKRGSGVDWEFLKVIGIFLVLGAAAALVVLLSELVG